MARKTQTADAGSYSVVITNMAGTDTSLDAFLTVVQPEPEHFDSITRLPGGQFLLQLSGTPGHYAIDASSNFTGWLELTNFTTANPQFQYTDPQPGLSNRFYRARLLP